MLSEIQLKERLLALEKNDFHLPQGEDGAALIPAMLEYIGSTDSVLRDDLIYSTFATWISADGWLSQNQLRSIAQTALDERHLFYGIGEKESDSVFTRTFSVLLLPLVLERHRRESFLTLAEVVQIKKNLLRYLRAEQDRRGFVPGKGWAHSVAHSADALDELAQCSEMDAADLDEILQIIQFLVCWKDSVYTCGEEERLVTPAIAVIRRQALADVAFSHWVQGFADAALAVDVYPQKLILRSNVKNFLQSLYFRLQWALGNDRLHDSIYQALYQINPFAKKGI